VRLAQLGRPLGRAYNEGAMDGDDPAGLSRIGACRCADGRAAIPAITASEAGDRRQ
jgi:hypothetical protein